MVGYMGVLRGYCSKGVGNAIFTAVMEKVTSLDYETLGLFASKLGEPLYRKFGFQAENSVIKYQILSNKPENIVLNNKIKIIDKLPKWVMNLDKFSVGIDRSKYFRIQMELGAKLIVLVDRGFGFYYNGRIGPIITQEAEMAVDIINKGIFLRANHLITSKFEDLSAYLSDAITLDPGSNQLNLKMYYGKIVPQNLEYMYGLGSFTVG